MLGIKSIYIKHYKKLLIIPILILLLAFIQIGYQYSTTGDFINRGLLLKGGTRLTITTNEIVDLDELESMIKEEFTKEIALGSMAAAGKQTGITIDADIESKEETALILSVVEKKLGPLTKNDYSEQHVGSGLGASFFKETIYAIILAFVFMSIVVFIIFRIPTPSLAVILSAFSDMVVTLAVVNLIGMKVGIGGIAAFLMLIGYSVDTDILLSNKLIKSKDGSVLDRLFKAMKTGLTMSLSTIVAVSIALYFSQSEIIRQIMTILLIGLLIDLVNTWIQNAGLLRLFLEKKHKHHGEV